MFNQSPAVPKSTGTFGFMPSVGECVLNAFSRLQLRGSMIKAEHLMTATMEANLMQQEWNNKGPNLWAQDSLEIMTQPGVATYPVPVETVMVTNVTIGQGAPPWEQELTITPISRQIYSMYPNKSQPGRPTVYWFDRLLTPTITLWPVPDQVYTMHLWRFRVIQDAKLGNDQNFEIPVLWLDAACAGLASRLAVHYAPALEQRRKAQYDESYKIASTQNVEDSPMYILPMVQNYYR